MARQARAPRLVLRRARRQERFPTFTRGPRELAAALLAAEHPPAAGPLPAGFTSYPEYLVYRAHEALGLVPGTHFLYQRAFFGGRMHVGGMVVDFLELDVPIALDVQGLYQHYGQGTSRLAADAGQRSLLQSRGIQLIYLDEDDVRRDARYYVAEARKGIDHSRLGRGFTGWQ